jgi:hypothetical protein
VRVITSQHERYGGTDHLFIGTGHSPDKITFVSLITNHNHDTNYQGLRGPFLFKSVPPFVSCVSSCRSSFNCSFGIYLHVVPACISSCRRCFCLEDLRRRRRSPTYGAPHLVHTRHVEIPLKHNRANSNVVRYQACTKIYMYKTKHVLANTLENKLEARELA